MVTQQHPSIVASGTEALHMALWHRDTLVLWWQPLWPVALWCPAGTLTHWYRSTLLAPWHLGTMESWHPGTVIPWYQLWHHSTMAPPVLMQYQYGDLDNQALSRYITVFWTHHVQFVWNVYKDGWKSILLKSIVQILWDLNGHTTSHRSSTNTLTEIEIPTSEIHTQPGNTATREICTITPGIVYKPFKSSFFNRSSCKGLQFALPVQF